MYSPSSFRRRFRADAGAGRRRQRGCARRPSSRRPGPSEGCSSSPSLPSLRRRSAQRDTTCGPRPPKRRAAGQLERRSSGRYLARRGGRLQPRVVTKLPGGTVPRSRRACASTGARTSCLDGIWQHVIGACFFLRVPYIEKEQGIPYKFHSFLLARGHAHLSNVCSIVPLCGSEHSSRALVVAACLVPAPRVF